MSSIDMSAAKAEKNAALFAIKEESSSMIQSRTTSKKKKNAASMKRRIRPHLALTKRKKERLLESLQSGIQQ